MLSKAQNKYIRSLTHQKYRKLHNSFIVEGDKIVREWLNEKAAIQMVIALQDWADQHNDLISRHPETPLYIVKESELESLSALQTPNQVMLVVDIPAPQPVSANGWSIALDNIQDPGNMGTIIRIADWFGIKNIACSPDCVDVYNPKVVQSAMGGHLRVNTIKVDLNEFISGAQVPVLAATLDGENIYTLPKLNPGILI